MDLAHWQTPAPIDAEPFTLADRGEDRALLRKAMRLMNASGTVFDLEVEREVRLFPSERTWNEVGVAPSGSISVVGFESRNRLTNRGTAAWRRDTGLVSIWIAGTFAPSPSTIIVLPFRPGGEPELGPVVNDKYFGRVPSDRLALGESAIYFRGDGQERGKIGVSPSRARPILGSYDADEEVLTVVTYTLPAAGDYVSSLWEQQREPYAGDASNAYNDGPAAPARHPSVPSTSWRRHRRRWSSGRANRPSTSTARCTSSRARRSRRGGARFTRRRDRRRHHRLFAPGMNSEGPTFVDAHVHFWDGARLPYPWLAEVPAISGPHTPLELATEMGAHPPTEMVFVESAVDPRQALDEVRWVEDLAVRHPRISALVAQVAVDRGAQTEMALAALGGHARVRGVRHIIEQHPEPDYCVRPAFVTGVRRVGERGWTFDLCVKHSQLPACIALVRACPGTTFVLDHAGKPDIRRGALDPWRAHIAELARLPNVVCKLSGLVTEADPATWTPDVLGPYVDHLLSCFGSARLLFGSDWPVVNLAASYGGWLETALELLEPLSAGERAAILSDNARRIYRLKMGTS